MTLALDASPSLLSSLASGSVVLLAAWLLFPDSRRRAIAALPCPPSTLPLVGNTLDLMFFQLPRLHDWITEQCLRLGGRTWRLDVLGAPPLVVVSSVAAFEDVLKTQFEVFDKGPRMNRIFRSVAGDGIVAVDGDKWRQQRKALSHLFTRRQFRDAISEAIHRNVQQLGHVLELTATRGSTLDLGEAFHAFAFDTFTEIAFGLKPSALEMVAKGHEDPFLSAMTETFKCIELRFHQPDWLWQLKSAVNVGTERKLKQMVELMDERAYAIINEALAQRHAREADGQVSRRVDAVSLAMDHIDELRGPIKDKADEAARTKYLRDVSMTVIGAGKDTTGTTLQWFVIMIARFPPVLERIREELRRELPRLYSDPAFVPSMEDVESLVYLDAVIHENLRVNPLIPLNAKEANRDVTLCDGTFIKKGTRVYIPSYALARMPSVWGSDAAEFKPERWLESAEPDDPRGRHGQRLRTVSPYQFVSFHAGPRICLGMNFALVELKTTLAYLLSKFDLTPLRPPEAYSYDIASSLAVKGPLLARVSKLKT
ncbi:hypothetical protein P43SY_005331 [Pythium insidiosum]|uniref:Cytochrome P450 n=1 Tax=Pythium insidiosum TaxID=114742 RepID=A0AAD5M755_PYTIN|nr:hypothetical protein P43SY_005331 [Pythium insidiosum]